MCIYVHVCGAHEAPELGWQALVSYSALEDYLADSTLNQKREYGEL